MSRIIACLSVPLVAGFAALAAPAVAQSAGTEMTAEEISEAFQKQKTRGLVIVPATGGATDDAVEEAAVTAAAAGEYNEVAREDQVNIQIAFDYDSAAIRPDQKVKLGQLCEAMKSVDVAVFQIIGHTDSSGKASYNERLSLLRAEEVKRHLINDCGIEDTRLKAIGMGETAPFNADNPRADENRRVEFQALG
ncbi:OmpA family protein [Marinibacterium sp. SX1]|uniref:OmpA family protein n=1 Tax=Marinibacterium sp. SX1 TaxID=3388424 RepID=UPI003D169AE2